MKDTNFSDLTIKNAFMFSAVMTDEEICRKVIELALGIPIAEVHVHTEKTMAYHPEYHGIRLDVYACLLYTSMAYTYFLLQSALR